MAEALLMIQRNCDMAETDPKEVQALPEESWKKYMPDSPRDPSW